jgi:hypothetical protein
MLCGCYVDAVWMLWGWFYAVRMLCWMLDALCLLLCCVDDVCCVLYMRCGCWLMYAVCCVNASMMCACCMLCGCLCGYCDGDCLCLFFNTLRSRYPLRSALRIVTAHGCASTLPFRNSLYKLLLNGTIPLTLNQNGLQSESFTRQVTDALKKKLKPNQKNIKPWALKPWTLKP